MYIQNRQLDNYIAFGPQSERSGSLRVSAPPRRLEASATEAQTASGNAASENPVDFNSFAYFEAMLKREVESLGDASSQRSLDQIAAEVRSGTYRVDAEATAARLSSLESLLR